MLRHHHRAVQEIVIVDWRPDGNPSGSWKEGPGRGDDLRARIAEAARLEQAVLWLASQGILLSDSNEWSFLHQTFFDYCYARRFVESGRSLAGAILESDQGLSVRPLLVQVLSYHRAGDPRKYLAELRGLFASDQFLDDDQAHGYAPIPVAKPDVRARPNPGVSLAGQGLKHDLAAG
jgi:hypothetical protein